MFQRIFTSFPRRSLGLAVGTRGTKFSSTSNQKPGIFEAPGGSTIYAVSSGFGKCGVAVVRISGPAASAAIFKMTKTGNPQPRKALLRTIKDPESKEVLDKGLCLWFPGPNSFTGEDSVEFHVHGGPAIITAVLSSLSRLGFRSAEPGEFTRRAFLNGKLDLTEAEAFGDLIDAETEQQRRQAVRQSSGILRSLYETWRGDLLWNLAALEASIDFEEEDSLGSVLPGARKALEKLLGEITRHLEDGRRGEILRSGARLVIVGEPNAGKSSLMNILSGRDAAIVTSAPGTTRDLIDVTVDVHGYPVLLTDTAGIREQPRDEIEAEGIKRALERAREADLLVCLVDARDISRGITKEHMCSRMRDLGLICESRSTIFVANKVDLLPKNLDKTEFLGISCKTGAGMELLLEKLAHRCEIICGDATMESPVITRSRYREHLTRCAEHIETFLRRTDSPDYDVALSSEEVRAAARELGKITGLISTEEVLDVIFHNFCIGK